MNDGASRYRVQPLGEDDIDAVAAIEAEVAAFPWTRGNFADCVKAGYSAWVLCQGRDRAGYAVLMMAVDEAHLLNLGVAAGHQRQGLGRLLLETVVATAAERGAAALFLEVRPSNTVALGLYRRHGFVEIGRRKAYYPAHLGREDALVLRRELHKQP